MPLADKAFDVILNPEDVTEAQEREQWQDVIGRLVGLLPLDLVWCMLGIQRVWEFWRGRNSRTDKSLFALVMPCVTACRSQFS